MVPIEKDPNPAVAPFSPYPQARSEASARPPLVELKIPVTIHCHRIVEGSDKREPFSETARTVLVFSHGAFVRIATTLIPGQRVFLFNEKAQKEVVCQVVKSAPCGSASCLVELQFSEPAAGFWDLPIPVAPPASVSTPPIPPADLETILPIPPAAVMAAAPKSVAPVPTFIVSANPAVAPPPLPVVKPAHATPQSVVSTNPPPESSIVPSAAAPLTPKISPAQAGAAPASPAIPPSPVAPNPATSASSLLDFSEEFNALFDGTNAPGSPQVSPATSAPHPSPAFSLPSVEQLMLQATSLQASLNSLHFSATLPAPPPPSVPPVTQKREPLDALAAKTVLEFALEPKPVVKSESESFHPGHQQIPPFISVEPLSDVSVSSEESFDVLVVEEPRRWQTDESDAQVRGRSPVQVDQVTLVLAASVLLVLGAGTLYLRQNHSATTTPATTGALSTPSSPASLQPAKNSTQVPSLAASALALDSHVSSLLSGNTSSAQPAKKSALGDVHLSAPVVNRGTNSQQIGDALPTIETEAVPAGVDPLAAVAFFRGGESAVPLPVGGDVKAAQLIKSVPPIYQPIAGRQSISGEVQIDALIDSSGNVAAVKALSGPVILRTAALVAVKQWKFSPALLDGQPTAMHLTVTLRFRNE
jgi:TonB family protein